MKITGHQWLRAQKAALAKRFRRQATDSERQAWCLLRSRRMLGLKFRRQQVIDGFIVDFYCPALNLAIEIDGAVHRTDRQEAYDLARTEHLAAHGIKLIRIPNTDVNYDNLRRRLLCEFPLSIHGEGDRG